MRKRRIGTRRIYRATRGINRHRTRYATRMLGGASRPRRPNWLAIAGQHFNQAMRIATRMAKREPNLFGPGAHQYYLETLEMEKLQREISAAIDRVYGKNSETDGRICTDVWTQRYPELGPRAEKCEPVKKR